VSQVDAPLQFHRQTEVCDSFLFTVVLSRINTSIRTFWIRNYGLTTKRPGCLHYIRQGIKLQIKGVFFYHYSIMQLSCSQRTLNTRKRNWKLRQALLSRFIMTRNQIKWKFQDRFISA